MTEPMLCSRRTLVAAGLCSGVVGFAPLLAKAAEPAGDDAMPDRIDLRDLFPPVKDQGDRNSCAFFATVALVEALMTQRTGVITPLSEQFLIHVVKSKGIGSIQQNTNIGDALDGASEYGIPPQSYWPYSPVSWLGAGQRCASYATPNPESSDPYSTRDDTPAFCFAQDRPPEAAFARAKSIAPLIMPMASTADRFSAGQWDVTLDPHYRAMQLVRWLALSKKPCIVTVKQPDSFAGWGDDGVVSVAEELRGRTDIDTDEDPVGNHFIVISGYDLKRQIFTFRNSWGENWGNNGYGTISFDVMATPMVLSDLFFLRTPPKTKAA